MNRNTVRVLRGGLAACALLAVLYLSFRMYLSGSPLLGSLTLGGLGLMLYVYSARRAYTYRYLFPGLMGIAIFVVLPLVFTIWIGFTNYSSGNLLTFERATAVLLSDVYQEEGDRFRFTLHRVDDGFRLLLEPQPAEPAGEEEAIKEGDEEGEEEVAGEEDSIFGEEEGSIFDEEGGPADEAPADEAPADEAEARQPAAFVTPVLSLTRAEELTVEGVPLAEADVTRAELGEPLALREVIARRDALGELRVRFPDDTSAVLDTLRTFAPLRPVYLRGPDDTLVNQRTGEVLTPDFDIGFYVTPDGEPVQPGFRVTVGFANYVSMFLDPKFRGPFFEIFIWNVAFAGLSVFFTLCLGLVLAEILNWEGLRFRGVYRILLFLPYAVPAFISILVFKGLFNSNFGEINVILNSLFGIKPQWFEDAFLAKTMIIVVNTWLGYPYFMLLCMGLQKSIPKDLYEASALAGAGPLTNFFKITWPLIRKPLTPLLISSFAFNFNNFVLIFLLTGGRPDFIYTTVPAGETDILVSYTYRIAFEYAGQNFGLAASISTLIFILVAIMSVINLRLTNVNETEKR